MEIEQTVGRRSVIAVGVGGAAVPLLPFLHDKVAAKSATPPQRPTTDDVAILGALQQIELAARDLYDNAAGLSGWSAAELAVVAAVRESHEAFAQSIAGMLGVEAPNTVAADVVKSLGGGFSSTSAGAAKAAHQLESALVATHLEALGMLQGVDGATLIASIQMAEARHTTVFGELAGYTDDAHLLVDEDSASLLGDA